MEQILFTSGMHTAGTTTDIYNNAASKKSSNLSLLVYEYYSTVNFRINGKKINYCFIKQPQRIYSFTGDFCTGSEWILEPIQREKDTLRGGKTGSFDENHMFWFQHCGM